MIQTLWRCALSPGRGFRLLAAGKPHFRASFLRMLLLRIPIAIAESLLASWSVSRIYQSLLTPESPFWQTLASHLPAGMRSEDLQESLHQLPPLPPLLHALPWILLLSPILIISLWLHDAVWDHGCLWMLRGLKEQRSFRITMLAEAEALAVGSLGALIGLLVYVPEVGPLLTLPVALVGVYFWILRGFALAAFHECPPWKGVLATVIHGLLMGCCAVVFLMMLIILFAQALG